MKAFTAATSFFTVGGRDDRNRDQRWKEDRENRGNRDTRRDRKYPDRPDAKQEVTEDKSAVVEGNTKEGKERRGSVSSSQHSANDGEAEPASVPSENEDAAIAAKNEQEISSGDQGEKSNWIRVPVSRNRSTASVRQTQS